MPKMAGQHTHIHIRTEFSGYALCVVVGLTFEWRQRRPSTSHR